MISGKVQAQTLAVRILSAHLQKERLAATYMLSGSSESGGEELAMAFACALQCDSGAPFEFCECSICSRIRRYQFPDVRWVGMQENARSIKIEEIRDLMSWVALKPFEGAYKVFILKGAERLTPEASNALLKTLEEPPAHTLFILLVENKNRLLPTIQSRSFEIRLRPLEGQQEMEGFEMEGGGTGVGSPAWEDFFDSFQGNKREELQQMFADLMRCFRDRMKRQAAAGSEGAGKMRDYLKAMDEIYETWDAVSGNANQKLALSRIAMRLRKVVPSPAEIITRL